MVKKEIYLDLDKTYSLINNKIQIQFLLKSTQINNTKNKKCSDYSKPQIKLNKMMIMNVFQQNQESTKILIAVSVNILNKSNHVVQIMVKVLIKKLKEIADVIHIVKKIIINK